MGRVLESTIQQSLVSLSQQVQFAMENTEYWKNKELDVNQFPIMTKEVLRSIVPRSIFPQNQTVYKTFQTSGTTGAPTEASWTKLDWDFLVKSISSQLIKRIPDEVEVMVNGYSMSHLSGNLYTAIFEKLGLKVISLEDFLSTKNNNKKVGLIINYNSISNKVKIGLKQLLVNDPSFIEEKKIKMLIMSSTSIPSEIKNKLNIDIISMYGCSEVGYLGYSCRVNSKRTHLFNDFVRTEILNDKKMDVSINERGRIVVSKIKNLSSQFLRLDVQDTALFIGEVKCECGFLGKSISDIMRT